MNYEALKAELDAGHPTTGAYDADAATAAGQLNALNRTRIVSSMSGSDMWANTVPAEFNALEAAKRLEWLSFCAITGHNPENNGLAHKFVEYIFGASSTTESNLGTARSESISRAVEVVAINYSRPITKSHVAYARTL